jgi:DNA-binding NarL/FixJ family response regulator
MLRELPRLRIVGEAWDGWEALEKARELQPDLILLDIGLPTLNGIEAARRIRELSPKSKILFLSENRSWDIAEEALRVGGSGYVVKMDAPSELLPAIRAVLEGKRFVSARLAGHNSTDIRSENLTNPPHFQTVDVAANLVQSTYIPHRHEVGFYSDDQMLLDDVTRSIAAALKAGSAAVIVATEPHRENLLPRLQASGLDVGTAIEQGRYVAVDAADTISTFMIENMLDTARFIGGFGDLILTAAKAAKMDHPRVVVFGEGADVLWKQGHAQAAIQDEKLCNQLIKMYDVDILCGYSVFGVEGGMAPPILQRICAEHSAVHSG